MRRTQKRERQREDHHPNLMFYAMQYYKEQIGKNSTRYPPPSLLSPPFI